MNRSFFHYSSSPLGEIRNTAQEADLRPKPKGLWLSDCAAGDGWVDWCKMEDFGFDRLVCRSIVELDMANILLIDTEEKLLEFSSQHVGDINRYYCIDWGPVAEQYKGIVISPYQWNQRLDLFWYYGWDCASGCVWDASAIKSIKEDNDWKWEVAA